MFFNNKKIKKAFTLAEMLIVLVIMALLSTLCLRSINDSRAKQETVVKLQKTYEEINKAVINGVLENGSTDYWDFSLAGDEFVDTYINTLRSSNEVEYTVYKKNDRYDIEVDINGAKRGKNIAGIDIFNISLTSSGEVLFPTWNVNGDVSKEQKTREELLNNSTDGCNEGASRYWCGSLIQKDGWKIKDDYPWGKMMQLNKSDNKQSDGNNNVTQGNGTQGNGTGDQGGGTGDQGNGTGDQGNGTGDQGGGAGDQGNGTGDQGGGTGDQGNSTGDQGNGTGDQGGDDGDNQYQRPQNLSERIWNWLLQKFNQNLDRIKEYINKYYK